MSSELEEKDGPITEERPLKEATLVLEVEEGTLDMVTIREVALGVEVMEVVEVTEAAEETEEEDVLD